MAGLRLLGAVDPNLSNDSQWALVILVVPHETLFDEHISALHRFGSFYSLSSRGSFETRLDLVL